MLALKLPFSAGSPVTDPCAHPRTRTLPPNLRLGWGLHAPPHPNIDHTVVLLLILISISPTTASSLRAGDCSQLQPPATDAVPDSS